MAPSDRQDVLVALCNDKAAFGTLGFKDGIGGSCSAMVYVLESTLPVVLFFKDLAGLLHTLLHSNGLVLGVRGYLCANGLSVGGDYTD